MSELTAAQEKRRAAVESVIRLMEPGLNLILAAGDRLSRFVEPEDHEYYPARPLEDRETRPLEEREMPDRTTEEAAE